MTRSTSQPAGKAPAGSPHPTASLLPVTDNHYDIHPFAAAECPLCDWPINPGDEVLLIADDLGDSFVAHRTCPRYAIASTIVTTASATTRYDIAP